MIFIQNLPRFIKVELVFRRFFPGQLEDVFEIGANNVVIGRSLGQFFETLQFTLGFGAHLFRQVRFVESLPQHLRLSLLAAFIFA